MVGRQDEARNTVYGHLLPPSPKPGVQPFSTTVTVSSKVVLGCDRHVELVKGWGEEGCRGTQAGVSLQGPKAGERDSCSVYGTGRIHCEQSRSVNYRRAINRAETDPRVSQEQLGPSSPAVGLDVGKGWLVGVQGCRELLQRFPGGSTTTICLADFGTSTFLLVSLRSEQSCAVPIWEKRALQPRSPPLCLASGPHRLLAGSRAHLAQLL